jgi:hypothetical protein
MMRMVTRTSCTVKAGKGVEVSAVERRRAQDWMTRLLLLFSFFFTGGDSDR